jgi:hypothetical protein
MMRTLDEIMLATGTDKNSAGHGYAKIYDELFTPWRLRPIRMIELGVWEGSSLRAWAEYFSDPHAEIIGLDNDLGRMIPVDDPRIMAIPCDVCNSAALNALADSIEGPVDIVIDDASHQVFQQRASFDALWPLVAKGGLYVIEDLHTLFWARANPPEAREWLHTMADETLGMGLEPRDNDCEVDRVTFYNSLVVFRKRL